MRTKEEPVSKVYGAGGAMARRVGGGGRRERRGCGGKRARLVAPDCGRVSGGLRRVLVQQNGDVNGLVVGSAQRECNQYPSQA